MLDFEAGRRDRGRRVASGVAPAERARPEHPVHSALAERNRVTVREHVLIEAQLAAGAQHTPQFRQRPCLVRHGAQHQTRDGGIERRILGRKPVRDAVEHFDLERPRAQPPRALARADTARAPLPLPSRLPGDSERSCCPRPRRPRSPDPTAQPEARLGGAVSPPAHAGSSPTTAAQRPDGGQRTTTSRVHCRAAPALRHRQRSLARSDWTGQSSIVVPTVLITNASGSRAASCWTAFQPVQCAGTRSAGESSASASTVGPMIGSNIGPLR